MDIKCSILDSVVGILPKPEQVHKLGLLKASSETSIGTRATALLKETSNNFCNSPVKEAFKVTEPER